MKTVLMFPGQGSQYLGMGKDFYQSESIYRSCIDQASKILDLDLPFLMFGDAEKELIKTENTQPALVAMSLSILEVLKQKYHLSFNAVVGHSLGEYTAYAASGRISFEEVLRLVRERGFLMSQAGEEDQYGMAAILKLDSAVLAKILEPFQETVEMANFNLPDQIVISGVKADIEKILLIVKEHQGKGILLPVGGAFHSRFMKPVAEKLKICLKQVSFQDSSIALYSNINAQLLKFGEEVESLEKQIYSCVLFCQSIENMIKDGYDTFIEIGAGKVLQGLVKKIDKNVSVFGIEKVENLNILQEKTNDEFKR